MFAAESNENLAFLSRQLSHLLQDSDPSQAIAKLSAEVPRSYAADLKRLKQVLDGTLGRNPDTAPGPYRLLSRLLAETGQKDTLIRAFVKYVRESKVVFDTYWAGVVGLTSYLGVLATIVLVLALVFSQFVMPSFEQVFHSFGAELPTLTKLVFRFGDLGIPVLAIVVATVAALVIWFILLFHRRIQQLRPLPHWPSWVPLFSRVTVDYNRGMFLNLCRILIESGVTDADALRVAARESGQPANLTPRSLDDTNNQFGNDSSAAELAVAARLGHFREELIHQCDEQVSKLSLTLLQSRDRFALTLKLLLYFFIGALVVSMYLPIFKLGAII